MVDWSAHFTYVANVVDATLRACLAPAAPGKVINVGTGMSSTLNQTITVLNSIMGAQLTPRYEPPRMGDVRHSTADISLARATLGYEPLVSFKDGLRRTIDWMRGSIAGGQCRGIRGAPRFSQLQIYLAMDSLPEIVCLPEVGGLQSHLSLRIGRNST